MRDLMFLLRWSGRELRTRPFQVLGLAIVIALGVGVYAGLSTITVWRTDSYDASFATLNTHDLQIELSENSFVPRGGLEAVVARAAGADDVVATEERLRVPTQVDASTNGETILVPGVLIGVDVADGGPTVDSLQADAGRVFEAADADQRVAVVNHLFARFYDLPAEMPIRVSGDAELDLVGHAFAPQYFVVTEGEAFGGGEAGYAAVYVPIDLAEDLLGRGEVVNELVLEAASGADVAALQTDIEAALESELPGVETTATPVVDEDYYSVLYDDIEGDQQVYNIFALLVLIGAAVGAFNLTRRMVEAQRRQIGTAMALGTPMSRIAARPMLTGALIAVLGVVFGIGVGYAISAAMGRLFFGFQPLPIEQTSISLSAYLTGAALGFVIPLVAVAWPVWRATRMRPVDALSPAHLSRSKRKPRVRSWLRLPGGSVDRLPARNLLRAPQRTILTVIAVAAALTVVVIMGGMLDTFIGAIDRGDEAQLARSPDRLGVALDGFYPVAGEGSPVATIAADPSVGAAQPGLQAGGEIGGADGFPAVLEFIDADGAVWQPTIVDGLLPNAGGGIALTEKAADDLGVGIGDTVAVSHPVQTGADSFGMQTSELEVVGFHDGNLRNVVYLSIADDSLLSPDLPVTVANKVLVNPAPGASRADVQEALFADAGVSSVVAAATGSELQREQFDAFTGIFVVIEAIALILALLIAFNSTSINVDERAREHATMFAFGLPLRTVLRLTITENAVIGLLATIVGLVLGLVLLDALITSRVEELFPDLAFDVQVSLSTIVTTIVAGVLVVALAPLLSIRRLRRLDLPSTLRVME